VTGEEIARLLEGLHRDGRTVVLVTHNDALAGRAQRRVKLRDGRVETAA
jgi:predicted ABC-type transport system involved in lysophospholipase L1 biosynthesis ATPase subunit